MRKRHSILQKKLKEVESILNELLSLPPETPYNREDIEQRFEFIRKLLSAEISSQYPNKKPQHSLQQIARRLNELETIFKEWDSIKSLAVVDHLETVSVCSSCLNGDGDGDVSPEFYEEEDVHAIDEKHNIVKTEEKRIRVLGVMSAGAVIGIAFMGFVIVKFSGCFNCLDHQPESCLLPPT